MAYGPGTLAPNEGDLSPVAEPSASTRGVWADSDGALWVERIPEPRAERRHGRHPRWEHFVRYWERPHPWRLTRRIGLARLKAWLGTLLARAAHVESVPAPAGCPEDEPAPVEPLDRLTPISPNAPSIAVARREALAA